jgi:exodeoxyribonuclease VII large subunit
LAAFNDEALARAIRACRVPVVSAVGHEVDFTIADFVADMRAPTPSAAAELVVPLFSHLETRLDEARRRLLRAGQRCIADGRLAIDDAVMHASRNVIQRVGRERRSLAELQRRLAALHPKARITTDRGRLDALQGQLRTAMQRRLHDRRRALETQLGTLSALSPLRVLERGYSITKRADGSVVRDAGQVQAGDAVSVLLLRGELKCRVESSDPGTQGPAQPTDPAQ